MNTNSLFTAVRYFTAFDPYHYTVENRPITDLAVNDVHLANGVDAAVNSSTLHGYALNLVTTGLLGRKTTFIADIESTPGSFAFTIKASSFFRNQQAISSTIATQIYKISLQPNDVAMSVTDPGGAGYARRCLVQARYSEPTGVNALPTFDHLNERKLDTNLVGYCELSLKQGSATTGTPPTPSPDAGWTGVLVAQCDDVGNVSFLQINDETPIWFNTGSAQSAIVSSATEINLGIVRIATGAEATGFASGNMVLTPEKLALITATVSRAGISELATTAEAYAGTDANKTVTPAGLKYTLDSRGATVDTLGLVELATSSECLTGVDTSRAVTPAGLKYAMDNAGISVPLGTTTVPGIYEVATDAEAMNTVDDTKAITPKRLHYVLSQTTATVPDATTTQKGIIEIADTGDVTTISAMNAVTDKVCTPALLSYLFTSVTHFDGSESKRGILQLASNTETSTGTNATKAVSPLNLATNYRKKSDGSFTIAISGTTAAFSGAITASSFQSTSSRLFKDNIKTLSIARAIDIVKASAPVTYTMKADGSSHVGFIAEDTTTVFAEAAPLNEQGNATSVSYQEYVPVHTAVLADLLRRIEMLEAAVGVQ